jgi:hypothetical protein
MIVLVSEATNSATRAPIITLAIWCFDSGPDRQRAGRGDQFDRYVRSHAANDLLSAALELTGSGRAIVVM